MVIYSRRLDNDQRLIVEEYGAFTEDKVFEVMIDEKKLRSTMLMFTSVKQEALDFAEEYID